MSRRLLALLLHDLGLLPPDHFATRILGAFLADEMSWSEEPDHEDLLAQITLAVAARDALVAERERETIAAMVRAGGGTVLAESIQARCHHAHTPQEWAKEGTAWTVHRSGRALVVRRKDDDNGDDREPN